MSDFDLNWPFSETCFPISRVESWSLIFDVHETNPPEFVEIHNFLLWFTASLGEEGMHPRTTPTTTLAVADPGRERSPPPEEASPEREAVSPAAGPGRGGVTRITTPVEAR